MKFQIFRIQGRRFLCFILNIDLENNLFKIRSHEIIFNRRE